MYLKRFNTPVPLKTPLNMLRGLEGQRVKALYKLLAQQHRIGRFTPNYDPASWDDRSVMRPITRNVFGGIPRA